jgi:DNA-binding NtrC family response regulator
MSPRTLIVDDDPDLGGALGDWVEDASGKPCLVVQSLEQLQRDAQTVLGCGLAIVDINLGVNQPSGLDVAVWLRTIGFPGELLFLTGHAKEHPLVRRAAQEDGILILEKPMDMDRLAAIISANA